MEERDDDIVVLVDEDGQEVEFEHLDTIEMNGNEYVVLLPLAGDEVAEADEVIILKIERSAEGEDNFITVDDEEELNEVFEEFQDRMDDMEDEDEV